MLTAQRLGAWTCLRAETRPSLPEPSQPQHVLHRIELGWNRSTQVSGSDDVTLAPLWGTLHCDETSWVLPLLGVDPKEMKAG